MLKLSVEGAKERMQEEDFSSWFLGKRRISGLKQKKKNKEMYQKQRDY